MDGNTNFMDLHSHLSHRKNQNHPRAHTIPQTQTQTPDTRKRRSHHTDSATDKKVAQSAASLHPPSSVFSGPSAKTSSAGSQNHSRRGSLIAGEDAGRDTASGQRAASAGEVASEAWRARMRREELRASIATLTKLSSITARRLDDTYYLLLEKTSALSSAIAQLRDIATLTARLHQDFQSEAEAIEGVLKGQIDAFNSGLESEQKTIEVLEGRVRGQRVKAAKLGERLEEVRRRVRGWERTEGEWQAKTSRWLRLLWFALLLTVVWFLGSHYWPGHLLSPQPSPYQLDTLPAASNNVVSDSSLRPTRLSEGSTLSRVAQERNPEALFPPKHPTQQQSGCLDKRTSSSSDAAERTLRLFDEL
ncbi:hypothetical protein GP486_003975 [Trichoglossum hirsutum]|uniref:Uncharacterized protein n=1 Tax=Trichoglossum hirsutum TaxID=265104 RepID=A0A9P8LBP1_9PEZI|nr:hypothetical protein GP486_003975 [Trichoglossum hirsutum]